MAALVEYYVDPGGGSDTTGTGTSGNPWASVSKALSTITRNSTNGDRINVKANGTDTLTAALVPSTSGYGNPGSAIAPLVIQGYTTTAGDGGVGVIDGAGSYGIIADSTTDGVLLYDLDLGNCGSATVVLLDRYCACRNVRFHTTTGNGVSLGQGSSLQYCHIENVGGNGALVDDISFCYFQNGTNKMSNAIGLQSSGQYFFNLINIDSTSNGISAADQCRVVSNTIYSNGGSGAGIIQGNGYEAQLIMNNYIEGFTSGIGLDMNHPGATINFYGNNMYYNNGTPTSFDGDVHVSIADQSAPGSSLLTAPGSEDFSIGTGGKAIAKPSDFLNSSTSQYLDIGAVQRQEAAAGSDSLTQMFVPIPNIRYEAAY